MVKRLNNFFFLLNVLLTNFSVNDINMEFHINKKCYIQDCVGN